MFPSFLPLRKFLIYTHTDSMIGKYRELKRTGYQTIPILDNYKDEISIKICWNL